MKETAMLSRPMWQGTGANLWPKAGEEPRPSSQKSEELNELGSDSFQLRHELRERGHSKAMPGFPIQKVRNNKVCCSATKFGIICYLVIGK
jgi:hypothetical protein